MPASFKFILAPRPDREGLHDVRLRVIAERVVRYFNVPSVAVAAKYWNPSYTLEKENWIKTSHHEHADLNEALFGLLRRAQKLSRAQPHLSADVLKELLSTGADLRPAPVAVSPDFLALAYESWEKDDQGHFAQSTCEARHTTLNKLAAHWGWSAGKKPLPCDQLTEQVIADFDAYMKRALGNGPGTRRKAHDILNIYVARAIKRKALPKHANPYDEFDRPTPAPVKVWLTDAELSALETVGLPRQQHQARATYFIQYYLHGSRIGVVLRLQWKQRALGAVRFRMDKGDREKVVVESPQLTALLDSFLPADGSAPDPEAYVLPWLAPSYPRMAPAKALQEMKRATAVVNMNLKRAGQKAGIGTHFSSHSSRRTLADNADNLTEDLGLVQGLLGHTTRATTEKYTRGRDTPAVHRGAQKVYQDRPMPQVKHE
ncbi:MAG: tyrosine-type recombinase/integrase [Janthinobacterium lividum]